MAVQPPPARVAQVGVEPKSSKSPRSSSPEANAIPRWVRCTSISCSRQPGSRWSSRPLPPVSKRLICSAPSPTRSSPGPGAMCSAGNGASMGCSPSLGLRNQLGVHPRPGLDRTCCVHSCIRLPSVLPWSEWSHSRGCAAGRPRHSIPGGGLSRVHRTLRRQSRRGCLQRPRSILVKGIHGGARPSLRRGRHSCVCGNWLSKRPRAAGRSEMPGGPDVVESFSCFGR